MATPFLFTITDPRAVRIIKRRLPIIWKHFDLWRERVKEEPFSEQYRNNPTALGDWVQALEHRISCAASGDKTAIRNGLTTWLDAYLIPLTEELGFVQWAEDRLIRRCLRRSMLQDPQGVQGDDASRVKSIDELVRGIFASTPHESVRVNKLVEAKLCRDKKVAGRVVNEVQQSRDYAAGLARGLVLAFCTYGENGLWHLPEIEPTDSAEEKVLIYPCSAELFVLLQQGNHIAETNAQPGKVFEQLIADITALVDAFKQVEQVRSERPLAEAHKNVARQPEGRSQASLWQQRLLTDPMHSEYRQRYDQKLSPSIRSQIINTLIEQGQYSEEEAQTLLATLLTGGMDHLIDFRSQVPEGQTQHKMERVRVRRALDVHFAALEADVRQEIAVLLEQLQDAMAETGVSFPLAALINSYPSSRQRRRIGARIWFALSSTMRRRQRNKRRRRPTHRKPPKPASQSSTKDASIDELVKRFAEKAGLDEGDGYDRLRQFITYGPLGLLSRNRWLTCIDPRLMSWMRLIKWGRLNGRVPWLVVLRQANVYRRELGLSGTLSSQLAKPIFNRIAKPSYWHAGQGETVTTVRQRGTVVLSKTLRLHEIWVIVLIELALPLHDLTGKKTSDKTYVLLVLDKASELPVGAWVSDHIPGSDELGLSLYQSIWHPGDLEWPLRGIPETIQIPAALASSKTLNKGEQATKDKRDALRMAAQWLLAEIDTEQKRPEQGLKQAKSMIERIEEEFPIHIQEQLELRECISRRVLLELLTWLKKQYFPEHRSAPIWDSVRKHGVLMPGYDTFAAGWLLPVVGEATLGVSPQHIQFRGNIYKTSDLGLGRDERLQVRQFPHFYAQREDGIFLQVSDTTTPTLRYVPRRD